MSSLARIFIALCILLHICANAFAQADKWKKKGDYFIQQNNYGAAIDCFKQATDIAPKDSDAWLRLAQCCLMGIEKNEALTYAIKSLLNSSKPSNELYFTLAQSFHILHRWDSATYYYQKSDIGNINKKVISKKIKECEWGKIYSSKPTDAIITNAGEHINTAHHEYLPHITADRSILYFTSRRSDSYGGKKDTDGKYFEDIYSSINKGGAWQKAINIGSPLNTEIHDACIGLSSDGQQMYIYRGSNGGDIYQSQLKGNKWTPLQSMPINTDAFESSACISLDERTLFFVRKTPEGNKDIYYCGKTLSGQWSKPKRWEMSSDYDDDFPFLHPDGKTIYFSSKGHSSMGGYDVFKCIKNDNGSWSKPENLGFPINSAGDDLHFVLSADGKVGFYSSDKAGGMGLMDVYSIRMPLLQASPNLILLKGNVKNNANEPQGSIITIIDNDSKEIVSKLKSNESTGDFLVSLPAGKNYGIEIEKKGMLFYSENMDIPAKAGFREITQQVVLQKAEKGSTLVLKNIFFESGSIGLDSKSYIELEKVKQLMLDNPQINFEIGGHTDNVGEPSKNIELSTERAKVVKNYLVTLGIDSKRLKAVGYGSSKPIANNDNEANKKLNRRTEFKIL
jgi:outer membrane protein OmpA-like peptidoglycan-associated protein/tetratricopeptide (TPR) repeat protein